MLRKLALSSLLDRKGSVCLSLIAMAVSVFVLLGVDHIRNQTKENFANTVSGIDLIVGARTGSLNLLLYSVFRIGAATNNISWDAYQKIVSSSNVDWAIPISLGDSHKGFRVMGTTSDYFKYFRYGRKHPLVFESGDAFDALFDVVLGAGVAKKLGYELGDELVLAHGVARTSFSLHEDRPFKVVGILAPTGTPVDQTLHVSLAGIEAIHINWQQGVKVSNRVMSQAELERLDLTPKSITAMMLGLKSRMVTFRVQRDINAYRAEPMLAILPGVALSELWQMIGVIENTLLLVSILVFAAACLGMSAMLLSSMRERKHEIHLLRVIGAPPRVVFLLIESEALLICLFSILLGAGALTLCLLFSRDYLIAEFGLNISVNIVSSTSLLFTLVLLVASAIIALIPSCMAYFIAHRAGRP